VGLVENIQYYSGHVWCAYQQLFKKRFHIGTKIKSVVCKSIIFTWIERENTNKLPTDGLVEKIQCFSEHNHWDALCQIIIFQLKVT
jgi:hypothetical protein